MEHVWVRTCPFDLVRQEPLVVDGPLYELFVISGHVEGIEIAHG